jgi:Fe-S-cluster-containing dehydrogenase component/CRP-like cAMP-binding protein
MATLLRVATRSRLPEVRETESAASGGPRAGPATERRIFLQDVPRVLDQSHTAVLAPGEIFGELAALTRSPRSATVFAEGEAVLLEIRWQGLRDLMRRTDALRLHIERLYRENSLRVHLRETPLLAGLTPEGLQAVADAIVFESYGEFDWHDSFQAAIKRRPGDAIVDEPLIAEEGMPSNGLLLIRSGFARQSLRYGHGRRTVEYLGRGRVFGLAEAMASAGAGEQAAWQTSLRALGYVDVLRIPQRVVNDIVLPNAPAELLAAGAQEAAELLRAAGGASQAATVDQGVVEFLVEHRLVNGQQAMVIDLDRCTRCDDCVRACAATHDNNPRFVRQGSRHGPLMVAQACMHCVDPVCMIGCPTGAIGRDPLSGVVRINDRTCIGCSTCANSCPYDNIQMVEIRDRYGSLLVDAATQQPLAKATKCDLCIDLPGGPACQRACPHDALVRLDLGNLGDLSEWASR